MKNKAWISRFTARLIVTVLFGLLASAQAYTNASQRIITTNGNSVGSLFDGLRPSPYAVDYLLKSNRTAKTSSMVPTKLLPAAFRRVVICGGGTGLQCPPDDPCTGSFTVIDALPPGSGCSDHINCPIVHNFHTDTKNATLHDGEANTYCGTVCCVDAYSCFS